MSFLISNNKNVNTERHEFAILYLNAKESFTKSSFKDLDIGIGEMACQSKILSILAKDLGLIPSTQRVA